MQLSLGGVTRLFSLRERAKNQDSRPPETFRSADWPYHGQTWSENSTRTANMVKLTSTRNDHHRKAIDSLNGIYNAFINLPIPVKVQIFREFKKTNQTIVSDIVGIREYTNKKREGLPRHSGTYTDPDHRSPHCSYPRDHHHRQPYHQSHPTNQSKPNHWPQRSRPRKQEYKTMLKPFRALTKRIKTHAPSGGQNALLRASRRTLLPTKARPTLKAPIPYPKAVRPRIWSGKSRKVPKVRL